MELPVNSNHWEHDPQFTASDARSKARNCVRNIWLPVLEIEIRKVNLQLQEWVHFFCEDRSKEVLIPTSSIVRTTTGLPFIPSRTAL